jgi:sugar phosphate isomerase/epimerase
MKYTRRKFLVHSILASASMSVLPSFASFSKENTLQPGIILNTVKNEMKQDYKQTLKKLAQMGYKYIEGGSYGASPEAYTSYAKDIGLIPIATGGSMGGMKDNLDDTIGVAKKLGVKYLICYYPWLTGNDQINSKAAYKAAENLNVVGKKSKDAGFKLLWHNHAWEFKESEGKLPFDIIMQQTDPELVGCQMDLYWVKKGNANPVDYFKKYPGRYDMVHVKDMDKTDEREIACVGDGIMDFVDILRHHKLAGIKYCIVENETPAGNIECARTSANHLKNVLSKI